MAGTAALFAAGTAQHAYAGEASDTPLSLTQLSDNIFVHQGEMALMFAENQGIIANTSVVIGNDCVAVVDTCGSVAAGRRFLAAIRRMTSKPVKYVFNTHMHPDHIFGNAAFLNAGTEFVGHKNLARALDARFAYYLSSYRQGMGEKLLKDVQLVLPTIPVADEMSFDLGGTVLTARAHGAAHTDCDLTVTDAATGTLFAGDMVVSRQTPTVDGSIKGWRKELDLLMKLPLRQAVPGHGPVSVPWPAGAGDLVRYLETVMADARRAIAAGVPMEQAVETIGLSESGKWQLFAEYNKRNATAAFAELEWE